MENTIIYSVIGVVALVLLFFIARLALRWIIRLAVIGLILVLAFGAAAWWWLKEPTRQPDAKPPAAPTRRATPDRR